MWKWVEDHSDTPFTGFMNGDILFGSALPQLLSAVLQAMEAKRINKRVLIIGRRSNFAMPLPLTEDSEWMLTNKEEHGEIVREMAARGSLFQTDAED